MKVRLPQPWLAITSLFPLLLLFSLTGCGRNAITEPTPPVIHYGEDMCEFCGMIISEERFAAGYITDAGTEHIFDDLAGMFKTHLQGQDAAEVVAFFVHDYEDSTWIRAETAHYVLGHNLPTPMLSGLVACATSDKAAALAAGVDGQVLTFDEVLAYYRENQSMAVEDGEGHHHHQNDQ